MISDGSGYRVIPPEQPRFEAVQPIFPVMQPPQVIQQQPQVIQQQQQHQQQQQQHQQQHQQQPPEQNANPNTSWVMSEPSPPLDLGFACYWSWLAHELANDDRFRAITTTPGLPDSAWMIDDVEKAVRELIGGRSGHLRSLLEGWEMMEKGLNREIAQQLWNEFMAGCRTLEDFENRNFSRQKAQQAQTRQHFPEYMSGNPMMMKASLADLTQLGLFPMTPTIYASQTEDFYSNTTTTMYYNHLFGDATLFYNVLQHYSRNPNQVPKVHPMPYHPLMTTSGNFHHLPQYAHFRPQFPHLIPPPVQFTAQPPTAQQNMYPQMIQPHFYPVQMAMPMGPPIAGPIVAAMVPGMGPQMPMHDGGMYAGQNYQQGYYMQNGGANGNMQNGNGHMQNGNGNGYMHHHHQHQQNGNGRQQRGSQQRNGNIPQQRRNNRNEQFAYQPRQYHGSNENANLSSSASSSTVHTSEERAAVPPKTEESYPSLQGSSTAPAPAPAPTPAPVAAAPPPAQAPAFAPTVEIQVELAAPAGTPAADTVLQTTRKFSDVVSRSASGSSSSNAHVEETGPAPAPVTKTPASEAVATNATSAPAAQSNGSSKPIAPVPATVALVVDTAEPKTTVVSPVSQRTVAEVVQASLSATNSPAPTTMSSNGAALPQQSPAVKNYASVVSPGNGMRSSPPKTPSVASASSSSTRTSTDSLTTQKGKKDAGAQKLKKEPEQRKQPSSSYAQMLYTSPKQGESSSSSSFLNSTPAQAKPPSPPKNPTDWQTMKPKKTAEPAVIATPPVKAPESTRSSPSPTRAADPSSSSENEAPESDNPELEKKRLQRRLKRQRMKEANKQKKQNEKETARQESLARVDAMNADTPRAPTPPPAFDRNNIAARRRKRLELQKQNERQLQEEQDNARERKQQQEEDIPILPIVTTMGERTIAQNHISASIQAGRAAMTTYATTGNTFRHRSSPFTIIAPNGTASIPLFLPEHEGGDQEGIQLTEHDLQTPQVAPAPIPTLSRPLDARGEPNEIDENANMVERLLMFDSVEKMSLLEMSEADRQAIMKGLADTKRMYTRVEKAGKLVSYKAGTSNVPQAIEEKLMYLVNKLLSNGVGLNPPELVLAREITNKISTLTKDFTYANFLTALLDFSAARIKELPEGALLKKNYEQTIVLTHVFMRKTKALFDRVVKFYDFDSMEDN